MHKRLSLALLVAIFAAFAVQAAPARIKINLLDKIEGVAAPVSGRLLVFMRRDDGKPTDGFGVALEDPEAVWVSGTEISDLMPGRPIEIDPDILSFPSTFSSAPAGQYQIFALLDRDHSYTYGGPASGDLYSEVARISAPIGTAELSLQKMIPMRSMKPPENTRLVEYESPLLSTFWGRPIKMQASVILPPGYDSTNEKYPVIYNVSGYGGTHLNPLRGAAAREKEMLEGTRPKMISVFLEAHVPLGHSVWADSVNNGPWGTALVKEFIPYLEKQFRMDTRPSGRFLTGHSSGGWSTLWIMVNNPDFFAGTWSTSPDPVDFRDFTGPNIYQDANAYRDASGKEFGLVRKADGTSSTSLRQYAQQERVLGYYGGQMASFNAVFSPRADDGQPMRLYDMETGRIDPEVAKAWSKYDISKLIRDNWKSLGPKLKGKLHIWVGTADTFHLESSVRLLDGELKRLGSDARITFVEGKNHFNVYDGGLAEKIQWEMYAIARPARKARAVGR